MSGMSEVRIWGSDAGNDTMCFDLYVYAYLSLAVLCDGVTIQSRGMLGMSWIIDLKSCSFPFVFLPVFSTVPKQDAPTAYDVASYSSPKFLRSAVLIMPDALVCGVYFNKVRSDALVHCTALLVYQQTALSVEPLGARSFMVVIHLAKPPRSVSQAIAKVEVPHSTSPACYW